MPSIESVTLEVADPTAVNRFYTAVFGLGTQVRLRNSEAPTTGFRGFTLSVTVSQPATVNGLIGAALDAGASPLKPSAKSFWGYGGVVRAPDAASPWRRVLAASTSSSPLRRAPSSWRSTGAARSPRTLASLPTAQDRTGS
jgi:catechol 2,3-dioxygenase-like lactoylglutathione lyase family enzyme